MSAGPLIDIGINLAHDAYDSDRDEVLARAKAVNVEQLIVTGSSVSSSRRAAELAAREPSTLFSTAGIHPHHADQCTSEAIAALRDLASAPSVVAIGECGLDYFRDLSPRPAQVQALRAQIELAIELGRPLFFHCRDAHRDFLEIVASYRPLPPAVLHCFTGTLADAEACLATGLSLGITGWICDERRGTHLKQVVRDVPGDRLLLETDGPYLLPRDLNPRPASRRNEPAYLPHILEAVAVARGEPPAVTARATTGNARLLFGLPAPEIAAVRQ
jgi:TatD DNase family protein